MIFLALTQPPTLPLALHLGCALPLPLPLVAALPFALPRSLPLALSNAIGKLFELIGKVQQLIVSCLQVLVDGPLSLNGFANCLLQAFLQPQLALERADAGYKLAKCG